MLFIEIFIFLIIFYLFIKKFKKNSLEVFPEPPANPIIGHMIQVKSTADLLRKADIFFKYGNTIRVRLGPTIFPIRLALLSEDYKFTEFILSSNKIIAKSEVYFFLKDWLGNGLLLSDGDYWKRHRKILTPAFHFEILKDFVEIFESVGDVLIKKLEKYDKVSSVDVYPLIKLYTLDVICESAMGKKMNIQSGENLEYVKSVKEMCRIAVERAFSPIKFFNWSYRFTRDYYKQKKGLNILHSFTLGVIDSKRKELKESNKKKMAFLELLLKFSRDENVLNNEEIREEVDTFMFEGHDTTAAGICFTLYCLCEHPEIQEKVLQEQNDLFRNEKNPEITYSDLQNMKYLDNVIKESMRLYPPVPMIGRCTTEDVKYEDCVIPKGTDIVIVSYRSHRNPEYFPDPEKFIPERFENLDGSFPYAYIPFSAGSRNCIGQKFAMLELKSVISKIVRNFEIKHTTPKHELELAFEVVLTSLNGIKVVLEKRN